MFESLRLKMERGLFVNVRTIRPVCWLLIVGFVFGVIVLKANDVQNAVLPINEGPSIEVLYSHPLLLDQVPNMYPPNPVVEEVARLSSPEKEGPVVIKRINSWIQRRKKREETFHPFILRAAHQHNVNPALIKAIIMAESGYNPKAVSKCGARGLMQLMPGTARALGVKDSFDPEHNIDGGVKYFRQLLDRFDNEVSLALAAYNAGARKVRRYKGIPPFGATQYYVRKVSKYYLHYKKEMAEQMVKNMSDTADGRGTG